VAHQGGFQAQETNDVLDIAECKAGFPHL
jgi:hypothetical protein